MPQDEPAARRRAKPAPQSASRTRATPRSPQALGLGVAPHPATPPATVSPTLDFPQAAADDPILPHAGPFPAALPPNSSLRNIVLKQRGLITVVVVQFIVELIMIRLPGDVDSIVAAWLLLFGGLLLVADIVAVASLGKAAMGATGIAIAGVFAFAVVAFGFGIFLLDRLQPTSPFVLAGFFTPIAIMLAVNHMASRVLRSHGVTMTMMGGDLRQATLLDMMRDEAEGTLMQQDVDEASHNRPGNPT